MADEARIEAASTAMRSVQEQWLNGSLGWPGEPAHLAKARAGLAAADAVDPLRALLADEDELVEFATQARYEASQINVARDFPGSKALRSWSDFPELAKVNWRAETRKVCGPVLAALREVAGL